MATTRAALEPSVRRWMPFYSLGIAHPGAVTLHNNPRFMHSFKRTDERTIDLIAVDLLRSRERGVPRYNEFRRQLRLRPAATFDEISGGELATANQLLRDLRQRHREGRHHRRYVRRAAA